MIDRKKIYMIVGIILLLCIIALGVWLLFFRSPDRESSPIDQEQQMDDVVEPSTQRTPLEIKEPTENEPLVDPMPTDKDRDGLTDDEEVTFGTNEKDFDSDNDYLKDGDEVHIYGTDPLKYDTDGDGFDDYMEIKNGYNPNGEGPLPTNQ